MNPFEYEFQPYLEETIRLSAVRLPEVHIQCPEFGGDRIH